MRWVLACIIVFVGGSLYFLSDATFDLGIAAFWVYDWDDLCYIWETVLTSMMLKTIITLIPKEKRWLVKPAFYYSLITIPWEITVPITKLDKNHPMAVNIGFLVLSTGLALLLLKDLRSRWEQNS